MIKKIGIESRKDLEKLLNSFEEQTKKMIVKDRNKNIIKT